VSPVVPAPCLLGCAGELVPEQLDGLLDGLVDQPSGACLVRGDGPVAGAALGRPAVQLAGAGNRVISCDLGIFVDQAAEPVPAQNAGAGDGVPGVGVLGVVVGYCPGSLTSAKTAR
jgi:hypothetical protein